MPKTQRQFGGEPLLREVLADPIVLAVIAGDGTTTGELETMIAAVQRRLASTRSRSAMGGMTVYDE